MNKVLLLVILFGSAVFIFVMFSRWSAPIRPSSPPSRANQPTSAQFMEKQASFAIFTNGTFRIFTASMYHNLSSDVFIEASNPNVVQIKKTGITWNDFFKTLPFSLTTDCLTTGTGETYCTNQNGMLKFYLNGTEDPHALEKQIQQGDKLLVSYGAEGIDTIQNQIQQIPAVQ